MKLRTHLELFSASCNATLICRPLFLFSIFVKIEANLGKSKLNRPILFDFVKLIMPSDVLAIHLVARLDMCTLFAFLHEFFQGNSSQKADLFYY